MFHLPVIQIDKISIANIDELNQKIKESVEFLANLRLAHNDNFETICGNLKIATDIEDTCKTAVADVLRQTGDINNLISALESMQKEARLIRLELDKAKKQYKKNKIENYNSI
jgi:vacuolar-type H+-ATPase subunit I/STV1